MNLLERRLLGFRTLDVILFVCLVALILGVYLAKTLAGRERGQIASVERRIAAERDRIILLEAEVAHLERPERLSALARGYAGLAPVSPAREVTPQGLADALQSPHAHVPAAVAPAVDAAPPESETSAVVEEDPAAPPAAPAAQEPKP